jgi:hypothetical protein
MVLLIGAGLLVRGLLKSRAVEPGFETRSVFMVPSIEESTRGTPSRFKNGPWRGSPS